MEISDYIKAGQIAGAVREKARSTDWRGMTVLDICKSIEEQITSAGARCAFPVNTSINEVAAHYTAEPGDETTVKDDDLIKIDLGAQVNGYIADTAVTISYDSQYDAMVDAAQDALQNAMSMIKTGVKASDIGRIIEKTIKDAGFKPIANLSGHSLEQYTIHAGRSIPNTWTIGTFSLSGSTAYACEPFVTTDDGLGFVREGKTRNIFALVSRKKTKDEQANRMIDYIWENFNMLPFARRWMLDEFEAGAAQKTLEFLVKKKAVAAYPILVEAAGKPVAQAEHTFIPTDSGATITTQA